MIAVTSRKAAVAPPCSAGSNGLPISFSAKGSGRGQFVAAPVEADAEEPDVGHALDQRAQRGVAALLDHLHRFGARARAHAPSLIRRRSTVKAPVAVGHRAGHVLVMGGGADEGDGAGDVVDIRPAR